MEKHAEILHEAVPKAGLIGFLVNPTIATTDEDTMIMNAAASALGQELLVVKASSESELEVAFAVLTRRHDLTYLRVSVPGMSLSGMSLSGISGHRLYMPIDGPSASSARSN